MFKEYGQGVVEAVRNQVLIIKFDSGLLKYIAEKDLMSYTWYKLDYDSYKKSSQAGQSLVGMLITVAIAGSVTLALATASVNAVKANTTATASTDVNAYVTMLGSSLGSITASSKGLTGQAVDSQVSTLTDPLTGVVEAGPGYQQTPQDAWSVARLVFVSVTAVPSATNYYRVLLAVHIKMNQARTTGSQFHIRNIGYLYCNIVNNVVQSCYSNTDNITQAQSNCVAAGNKWNVSAAYGSQCTVTGSSTTATNSDNSGDNKDDSPCDHNSVWDH